MRARTLFTACATACATALLFAGMSGAASAEAGTGMSMVCSDGVFPPGGAEHVVMTNPFTIAIERGPGSLQICYSTAQPGNDGQVTGGWIGANYVVSTAPTATFVGLRCTTDFQFGIAPTCNPYLIAIADQADLATATVYPNYVCVVYLNGPCAVFSPGATVQTDTTGAPTLWVDTFGTTLAGNPPGQCVALFVTPCP